MSERVSLIEIGHKELWLDGERIELKSLIGAGATCLVYDAVRMEKIKKADGAEAEVMHRIVLKEFYPVKEACGEVLTRLPDGGLKREDTAKQAGRYEICLERFLAAYHSAAALGGRKETASFVSIPFKCVTEKTTTYLMYSYDAGMTVEAGFCDRNPSLYRLFSMLYQTAESASRLHEYDENMRPSGSLHLDISPANLLLTEDKKIKLFDMDSFIPVDKIRDKTYLITRSDGYAAPEQTAPWRTRIGPWTDVFAIGAIAYRYLFGQKLDYVQEEGQIDGIRAKQLLEDFCFEAELDEAVIRKKENFPENGIRLLKQFFRKTLAWNYKIRYRNMREVQAVLAKLMTYSSYEDLYIRDNFQPNLNPVFGQETVRKQLEGALLSRRGKTPVFISGVGGIGKSTLARDYAQAHIREYEIIVEVHADQFADAVNQIEIVNSVRTEYDGWQADFKRSMREKADKIRALCADRKMLIIVHDYDSRRLDDLDIMMRTGADILVTSRCRWNDTGYAEIVLTEDMLSPKHAKDAAWKLFAWHYKSEIAPMKREVLEKLLAYVDYHPLTIELLAKQMAFSGDDVFEPEVMLDRLMKSRIETFVAGAFLYGKDQEGYQEGNAGTHLTTIFISAMERNALSKREIEALRTWVLLGKTEMTAAEFGQWSGCGEDAFRVLESLYKQGWIVKRKSRYRMLYPISEALGKCSEITPDSSNSSTFINCFYDKIDDKSLDRNKQEALLHISRAMWKWLVPTEAEEDKYANVLMEIVEIMAYYGMTQEALAVCQKMTKVVNDPAMEEWSEMRCGGLYYELGDYQNALLCHSSALERLKKMGDDAIDEEFAVVYNWLGKVNIKLGNQESAREWLLREKELRIRCLEKVTGDFEFARYYDALGRCCMYLGELEEASAHYQNAVRIREKYEPENLKMPEFDFDIDFSNPLASRDKVLTFGERLVDSLAEPDVEDDVHRLVAEYSLISCIEWKLGNDRDALRYAKKSIACQEEETDWLCPYPAYSLRWIARIYREKGSFKKEKEYESRAFKVLEETYGAEHEETKACKKRLGELEHHERECRKEAVKARLHRLKVRWGIPVFAVIPLIGLFLYGAGIWIQNLYAGRDPSTIWWEWELKSFYRGIGSWAVMMAVMTVTAAVRGQYWRKWYKWWLIFPGIVIWIGLVGGRPELLSGVTVLMTWQLIRIYLRAVWDTRLRILGYVLSISVSLICLCYMSLQLGIYEVAMLLIVCLIIMAEEQGLFNFMRVRRITAAMVMIIFAGYLMYQQYPLARTGLVVGMYVLLLYGVYKMTERTRGIYEKQAGSILFWYLFSCVILAMISGRISALAFVGIYGKNSLALGFLFGVICSIYKKRDRENSVNLMKEDDQIEKRREAMYRHFNGI